MTGGGKYEAQALRVKEETEAEGVILIVITGNKGHGFEVAVPADYVARIPQALRQMADDIERDVDKLTSNPNQRKN